MPNITNHQGNANQITMRDHLTPVRMAVFKKTKQIASVGEDVETREPLCSIGGNVYPVRPYGKQYGEFSKN